jgi:hypothetical protein
MLLDKGPGAGSTCQLPFLRYPFFPNYHAISKCFRDYIFSDFLIVWGMKFVKTSAGAKELNSFIRRPVSSDVEELQVILVAAF